IQTRMPDGYNRNVIVPFSEENALVSPGLKYLAFQWREPSGVRRIQVRELATGKELPPIHVGGYGGPLAMCFSANDRTLMWVDWYTAGGVVFSDVAAGKERRRLGGRRNKGGNYDDRPEGGPALAGPPARQCPARLRPNHT